MAVLTVLSGCIKERQTGADLKVGDSLPDFEVMMNDGTVVTDGLLRESVSIVMFFHTSCPDCQQTLPQMQKVYDNYASEGVRIVLMSRDESRQSIESFWQEKSLKMPCSAQNDRKVYEKFARERIPRVKGFELHSFPEQRRKPALYVRIGEPYYGDLESMTPERDIFLKIWLSIVSTQGIRSKKRHLHGLDQPVINSMSGLDVMISHNYRIITYCFHHTGEQMLGFRIYIIIIVCRIVTLKTVPGIDEDHIFLSIGDTDAVHMPGDRQERVRCPVGNIR